MKEIKFVLRKLGAAAFTSAWWAALVFKCDICGVIAAISSIVIIIMAIAYVSDHWNEG